MKLIDPRRAMSLASTLMMCTLLATVAFLAVSFSLTHLNLNCKASNANLARNLADSAAHQAIAKILEQPDWKADVDMSLTGADGGWGRVSFRRSQASDWGIPLSTNNLGGTTTLPGHQRSIPPDVIQVIGVGCIRGVTQVVEQIVAIPPYQYALASSGEIHSRGPLLIAGLEDPGVLADGVDKVKPSQWTAGYLGCNSASRESVVLNSSASQPTRVTGGVESVGGIKVDRFTKVLGPLRPDSSPIAMPAFQVSDYDPLERSDVVELKDSRLTSLEVTNATRQAGSLVILNGLQIKSGFLYVDGNLEVYGGIQGKGAIFVNGNMTLRGVSSFDTENQEALIVRGNLDIAGSDQNDSIFQGVIYSGGNLIGRDVTMVGACIANSRNAGGSQIQLERANAIHCPKLVSTTWSAEGDLSSGGPEKQGNFTIQVMPSSPGKGGLIGLIGDSLPDQGPAPTDPVKGQFRYSDYSLNGDGGTANNRVVNDNEARDFFDTGTRKFSLNPSDHKLVLRNLYQIPKYLSQSREPLYFNYASAEEARTAVYSSSENGLAIRPTRDIWGTAFKHFFEEEIELDEAERVPLFLKSRIDAFNKIYQESPRSRDWMMHGNFGFTFDPNRFVQTSDRIRRMLWHDGISQATP